MKIAFLHVGFPPDTLKPRYGDYLSMFQEGFKQSGLPTTVECVEFQVQKGILPSLEDSFDGYLCCGSANSVTDEEPWIKPLLAFVRKVKQTGRPLVGICFGHQLIAQALGGRVEKAKQGWGLGNRSGTTLTTPPWMDPPQESVNLLYSHQDQVVVLPDNAEHLLKTHHCPHAAFQVGDHYLAFQGHPEFEPAYLEALMEVRRERIGAKLVDQAKERLREELDNPLVMRWIIQFFTREQKNLSTPSDPGL
jgi:GMP synthase-like glutamine amidotransferase